LPKNKDEFRVPQANKKGGFTCDDKTTKLLRSVATEVVKIVGKKIISGDFNLTIISFPIKFMRPISVLHTYANMSNFE